MSFSYQWQRCDPGCVSCVDIGGATSQTYVEAAADVGKQLRVVVTDGVNTVTSACTEPVTATPPSPGSTIFDADMSGNADGQYAPFQALEYGGTFDGTPPASQRVQYDSVIRRTGSGRSLKLTLAPGDQYGGSTGERNIVRGNIDPGTSQPPNVVEGDDLWFGTGFQLDLGWQNPHGWSYWWEVHQVSALYQQASLKLALWAGVNQQLVQLNAGNVASPGGPWEVNRAIGSGRTISPGVWYDAKWHAKFSSGAGGLLRIWLRAKGEPWAATPNVDYAGPTLETGQGATVNYLLFGHYRGPTAFTTVVRFDGDGASVYRIAADEASIDALLA